MMVTKADDADIDNNVQNKKVHTWRVEYSVPEVLSRQSEIIREKLLLPWYRRLVIRSLRRYLTLKYMVDLISIFSKGKQLDRSSTGNKRKRYSKAYNNFLVDSLRGKDSVERATLASWRELNGGLALYFWRCTS